MRRTKAVVWWRNMHTEYPFGAADILATMPTDEDIAEPDAFIANMPSAVEVVTAPAEKAADLSAG